MDIYAQAKAKEPANDAIPSFLALYKTAQRVGTLLKESHAGKLVSEWQKVVAEADSKPELVEMAPAVSSLMSVKDAEELVSPSDIVYATGADSRHVETHTNRSHPYFDSLEAPRGPQTRVDSG